MASPVVVNIQTGPSTVQPFYATYDGTAYSLLSQPTLADVPVDIDNPLPVLTKSGERTFIALDHDTIVTGGTAIVALNSGNRSAGGRLQTHNAAGFYVNETGVAGVVISGGTLFVPQDVIYELTPSVGEVSVNSTTNGTIISGWGLQ